MTIINSLSAHTNSNCTGIVTGHGLVRAQIIPPTHSNPVYKTAEKPVVLNISDLHIWYDKINKYLMKLKVKKFSVHDTNLKHINYFLRICN